MTIDCYTQLASALETGPIVLATVIASQGSVPREVGAKMIVYPDGRISQTIGGGAGEAKVIQQAMTVLETGQTQRVTVDLSGNVWRNQSDKPQRETQGICGGTMQVWLERWVGERSIALTQQILASLQSGQSATLITPFAADRSPYLLPSDSNITIATTDAFVDILQAPPTLLIIGAGHVGIQLAKTAHLIGFQIAIQDDRLEWANSHHYPQASWILTESIASALTQFDTQSQLYAALVTRGYQYDLTALESLLQRSLPCQYIGMIGSAARVRQVFQAIEQRGIAPDILRSIYAPIGLDIGALTPEEIAISIAAELILVRRGGTGRPLSSLIKR